MLAIIIDDEWACMLYLGHAPTSYGGSALSRSAEQPLSVGGCESAQSFFPLDGLCEQTASIEPCLGTLSRRPPALTSQPKTHSSPHAWNRGRLWSPGREARPASVNFHGCCLGSFPLSNLWGSHRLCTVLVSHQLASLIRGWRWSISIAVVRTATVIQPLWYVFTRKPAHWHHPCPVPLFANRLGKCKDVEGSGHANTCRRIEFCGAGVRARWTSG